MKGHKATSVVPLAAGSARGPGRPRSPQADEDILQAALELLAERGFDGLSVEGVAERAGVGKTTVYRRWPSKAELLRAAVDDLMGSVPWSSPADLGDTRAELVAIVRDYIKVMSSSMGRVMPALVAEVARNPELARVLRRGVAARRRSIVGVLNRGVARGDLRSDMDRALAIDLLLGPVQYRLLITGAPVTRRLAEEIVDELLMGLSG
jgi:AcrR family transcriptional regulator